MSVIHAPYNFVPLSREVYSPEWAGDITHDIPFADGYCGHLDLTLTAVTPILVGGIQGKGAGGCTVAAFHQLPDGRYAIPGTSLKGMLRSVLEIVGFGKMQRVTDQQLSMRDLTPGATYTQTVNLKTVKAGWLRMEEGKWKLFPCEHIAVHQEHLRRLDNRFGTVLRKDKASERYQAQKAAGLGCERYPHLASIGFEKGTETITPKNGQPFQKPIAKNLRKGDTGFVVYTGQVDKKKREFLFSLPKGAKPLDVPGDVMKRFGNSHRSNPQNPETDYDWYMAQKWMLRQPGIPVFYVGTDGQPPQHLGLAFMFRIACDSTLHDTVRRAQPGFADNSRMDLAECLFGRIEPTGKGNLKSRVSIPDAVAKGNPQPMNLPNTVLSSPKPSYYPAYLVQVTDESGLLGARNYVTYASEEAKARGWKRYPVGNFRRGELAHFTRNGANVSEKVQIQLRPLPERTQFATRIHFHNLKRAELGALLWVVTWGGDAAKRHSIGLGKILGMGTLQVEIGGMRVLPNKPGATVPEPSQLMHLFSQAVMKGLRKQNTHAPLQSLPEIQQLLHMADPAYGRQQNLTYMPLEQFRVSKGGKLKREDESVKSVMLPYVPRAVVDHSAKGFLEQAKALQEEFKQAEAEEKKRAEEAERLRKEATEQARKDALKDLSPEEQEARLLLDKYLQANEEGQARMTQEISALIDRASALKWPLTLREYIAEQLKNTPFRNGSKKGREREKKIQTMLEIK